jgi:F-type H+-transporting ATPase subunit epsilon
MLKLELVTLEGVKFAEDVYEVLVPTPGGQIALFDNHAPLISLIETGELAVRRTKGSEDLQYYAVSGGSLEVGEGRVRVLVDEAAHSDELSAEESAKALATANELLRAAKDRVSIDKAQALVAREQTRLRVAELRRRKKR